MSFVDTKIVPFLKSISLPFSRFSLFMIFFWFGILKIIDTSPANPLVKNLLERTTPFISFENFIVFFSVFEMAIGICFLVPALNRLAILLLIPHMGTTFMPLFLLPAVTWQSSFTPTLEGQYIIKNLVIIALAITIAIRTNWSKKTAP